MPSNSYTISILNLFHNRTQKLYDSFAVESLLDELNIEWRNPKQAPGSWIPIEAFDNSDFDSRLAEEWIELIKGNSGKPIRGIAMCKDSTSGSVSFRPVSISSYNAEKNGFEGIWIETKERCRVHKVKLLFDVSLRILNCFYYKQFFEF